MTGTGSVEGGAAPKAAGPPAPLSIPEFRRVWAAFAISGFGTMVHNVGASWLMATIVDSSLWVALVQASATLPIMLFSLVAGALADGLDRRRIMLAAQLLMLSASAALAVLAYHSAATPVILLGLTFLIGCGTALHNPAWHATVGDIVPRETIPRAVSLNAVAFNVSRSVGPALGGAIVAVGGAFAAFVVNTLSYLGMIVVLLRLRTSQKIDVLPREALSAAIATGLRYVFMSPSIEVVLLRAVLFGFAGISVQALLPIVARDALNGGPLVFGILLGAFGAGAVLGGLFGSRLRERFGGEWFIRGCTVAFAAALFGVSFADTLPMAIAAVMLAGACWLLAMSYLNITVQLSTPRWVVARALAAHQTAIFGGMAVGSWLWGTAAETYGTAAALQLSGLAMLLAAAVGLQWPMPETSRRNLDPIDRWVEPRLALELQQRSGPIRIAVEYTIRPDDERAFLELMRERRRIRRRNGARQWDLMRDLAAVEQWVETYTFGSWIEYLRHQKRLTQEDAKITEGIRALHHGSELPRVHRMLLRPPG